MSRSSILPAAGLLLVLVAGMLAWLGSYPLAQPDEGRNAEVAREMVASGNYLVPHLNGLAYVDKPVVHYAITGATMRVLGVNEFAARLPSLVFTLLTALIVGWFGGRLWRPEVGWTAAALLLASPLTYLMARVVILDAVLALLMVTALVSFYFAVEGRAAQVTGGAGDARVPLAWRRWSIAAWLAIGLGILTKGPVALLIPPLVALPFAFTRRALRAVVYLPAVLLGVAVVVPWVVVMNQHLPDYLHYVLVTETWQRISSDTLRRTQPFWFFIPVLLVGAFPWIVMLLAQAWRKRKDGPWPKDPRILYLVLWIVLPFLFFSLSRSKLGHYMLPLVPAVALLAAASLVGEEGAPTDGRKLASVLWCILGAGLIAAALRASTFKGLDPALLAAAKGMALGLGSVALLAGAIGLVAKPRGIWLAVVFSLPILCLAFGGGPLMKAIGDTRSTRELARAIKEQVPGERQVVGIGAYPTSLPFYLGAPMFVSSMKGRELTSNYVVANYARLVQAPDSTLRGPDWWRQVLAECRVPTVFVAHSDHAAEVNALVAAGLPLIGTNREYSAYGPCRRVEPGATAATGTG